MYREYRPRYLNDLREKKNPRWRAGCAPRVITLTNVERVLVLEKEATDIRRPAIPET